MGIYNTFLGVDPGTEPAICELGIRGEIHSIKKFNKKNNDFDYLGISDFLVGAMHDFSYNMTDPVRSIIYIEDVHSVNNSGAKANFQFGRSVGMLQGMVMHNVLGMPTSHECKMLKVTPKNWQKEVVIEEDWVYLPQTEEEISAGKKPKKDTKASALNAAKRLLGDKYEDKIFYPTPRSYTVNHDMVDAYLIAYYAYTQHK